MIKLFFKNHKQPFLVFHTYSEHTTFVCRNHVFYINVSVLSSVFFQNLQSLLDQICQIFILSLRIVNFVTNIQSFSLEHVEDWQDLPVVWH